MVKNKSTHEFKFEDIKRKKILHRFSLVSIALSAFFITGLILFGSPLYPKLIGIFLLISGLLALMLIRFDKLFAGAFILIFTGPGAIIILSKLYGSTGAEFYYFPLFTLVFYIFRKFRVSILFGVYLAAAFILTEVLRSHAPLPDFQQTQINTIFYINIIFTLIISVMLLRLFIVENQRHQNEIELKNEQLKKSIDDIFQKNKEVLNLLNEIEIKNSQLNKSIEVANQKNKEIQLLFTELSHRTKNNLQLVSSLINIESGKIPDPTAKQILESTKNRIYSLSLLHQKLYVNNNLNSFSLSEYINDLINYLSDVFDNKSDPVIINRDIEDIELNIDYAIHIGLLINELLTNSFKHGMVSATCKFINICLKNNGLNKILIVISDCGKGIRKIANDNYSKSFGGNLINSLVNQLNGNITFNDQDKNEIIISLENITCRSQLVSERLSQN